MNIDIENKDQLYKWKKDAEESSFFGIKVKELDRDALLSVIGNISEESKLAKNGYENHIGFLEMCANRKYFQKI